MTVKELIQRARFSLKDNNRALYSDWQMLVALNEVLDEVYIELSTFSNNVLIKTETVCLLAGQGELPDDCLRVVNVYQGDRVFEPVTKNEIPREREYYSEGNSLYCSAPWVTVDYKPIAPEYTVDDMEEELDTPPYLNTLLKKSLVNVVQGKDLLSLGDELRKVLAGRHLSQVGIRGEIWSNRI